MGASKKDIQTPVNCFFPTKTTYSLSFNHIRHFSNSQILARLLSLFLMIENKCLFDGAVNYYTTATRARTTAPSARPQLIVRCQPGTYPLHKPDGKPDRRFLSFWGQSGASRSTHESLGGSCSAKRLNQSSYFLRLQRANSHNILQEVHSCIELPNLGNLGETGNLLGIAYFIRCRPSAHSLSLPRPQPCQPKPIIDFKMTTPPTTIASMKP